VNETLTMDRVLKLAGERGLKPHKWIWKQLQPYNGYPHDQRVLKWQALHLGITLGLIPPADSFPCDICGRNFVDALIAYHSEDYGSMTQYPLCRSCHTILHMRFRNPRSWRVLKEKHENHRDVWFKSLC
jgi:hypothetical protein